MRLALSEPNHRYIFYRIMFLKIKTSYVIPNNVYYYTDLIDRPVLRTRIVAGVRHLYTLGAALVMRSERLHIHGTV